jgi:glutathione S-transferase
MIKIYGCPRTRSTRAVWAAEEVGIEYELIKLELMQGEHRSPEFLALNPGGKVPVLVDGDLVLSESGAIVTYLGALAPRSGLVPEGDRRRRALYDKWCFFVIGELEQPLWTLSKHSFALPREQRVEAVLDTARWEFARAAEALSRELGDREYVTGDGFTMADILVAHTLAWAAAVKLGPEQDNLDRYAQRLLARPALARARAREDA